MVSKARELFPEPDSPVRTTNSSLGISTSRFFRLFSLAPRIFIYCFPVLRTAITFSPSVFRVYQNKRSFSLILLYFHSAVNPPFFILILSIPDCPDLLTLISHSYSSSRKSAMIGLLTLMPARVSAIRSPLICKSPILLYFSSTGP